MKTQCSLDGCDGYAKGSGLCESHLWRLKKHGEAFDRSPIRRFLPRGTNCKLDGCDNKTRDARTGLCSGHRDRLRRHGPGFDKSPIHTRDESGEQIIARALEEAVRDQCWEWPLSRNPSGYGWFSVDKKTVQVHREVCRRAHGEPPTPDHFACHSCDNPPCINKHHLRWDTHQGNIDDRSKRDRASRGSRHYKAKLDDDKVRTIISRLRAGECEHALAAEYGVTHGSIWFIANGRTWKHLQREPSADCKQDETV